MTSIAARSVAEADRPGWSTSLAVRRVVVALALVSALVPFVWVIRLATRPLDSYVGDPAGWGGGFTLGNFGDAWNVSSLGRGFLNSLSIVPASALLTTVLASLGGFALAKLDPPCRRILLTVVVLTIGVPLPAIIIPLFNQGLSLGYTDSRLGLILVYAGVFVPWGTFFLYSFFKGVPDSLIESARVDGSSELRVFLSIAVPLALPAIMTVFVVNLFAQWSELLLALVMLIEPEKQTATVSIALFSTQYRSGGPLSAAGMLITSLPILIVYFLGQRFIRTGAFAGAVKG